MDLLAVSLAFDSIGFVQLGYFHGVGYGLSVAAQCAWLMLSRGFTYHAMGLLLFGVRLAVFLYRRGRTYAPPPGVTMVKKGGMWVFSSTLFVAFVWPLRYVDVNAPPSLLGLAMLYAGVLGEAVADAQKTESKSRNPGFVSTGMYAYCRHPNYASELLMYWGSLVAALPFLPSTLAAWGPTLIGLVSIHAIILGAGMRRLQAKQLAAYGDDPRFRAYIARTKSVIPFVF